MRALLIGFELFFTAVAFLLSPLIYLRESRRRNETPEKVYIRGNQESKNVIVFIHGLQDDHSMWRAQVAHFGSDYKCILIDRTAGAECTYLDDEEIHSLIQDNGGSDDRVFCVTASAGCFPATRIQQRYGTFEKIVLLNMFFDQELSFCEVVENYGHQTRHLNYYIWIELLWLSLNRDFFFSYPVWLAGILLHEVANRVTDPTVYSDRNMLARKRWGMTIAQRRSTAAGYFELGRFLSAPYRQSRLQSKPLIPTCPVLSIIGTQDNIGHAHPYEIQDLAKRLENPLILLENGGHWFNQTHPRATNEIIEEFLSGGEPSDLVTSRSLPPTNPLIPLIGSSRR